MRAVLLDNLIDESSNFWKPNEIRIVRLILSEQAAGLNLRNNIYHGLAHNNDFSEHNCCMVVFLILKIIALKRNQTKGREDLEAPIINS